MKKIQKTKRNSIRKRNVMLAILPGLIVGGLILGADMYYDLDTETIMMQQATTIVTPAGKAISLTGKENSDFTVDTADKTLTLEAKAGGTNQIIIQSAGTGTNAIYLNASAGGVDINAATTLSLNTLAAQDILIGSDAVAQDILIGNAAATEFDATAILVDINAGASGMTVNSGAAYALDATTTIDLQATTGLTIDSAGATTIGIGTDANTGAINIGTAGVRTITAGNAAATEVDATAILVDINGGATGVTIDALDAGTIDIGVSAVAASDTSNINIGTSATARTITVGNAASTKVDVNALIIELDSAGSILADATTTFDLDAGGVFSINSSGGLINIGNDAINQNINIGTGGVRTVTVGNAAATEVQVDGLLVDINAGASGMTVNSGATYALNATTAVDIDTATLNLDASSAVNIGTVVDVPFDIDTSTLSIDSSGAIIVNVTGADLTLKTTTSGNIILDPAGTIMLEGETGSSDIIQGLVPIFGFDIPAKHTHQGGDGNPDTYVTVSRTIEDYPFDDISAAPTGTTRHHKLIIRYASDHASTWRVYDETSAAIEGAEFGLAATTANDLTKGEVFIEDDTASFAIPQEADANDWHLEVKMDGNGISTDAVMIYSIFLAAYDTVD